MLRIIGGRARGRYIRVPAGKDIRPTSDRVRESLFNIIPPHIIEGANFLDLFAGSGAVGIEALSRGASHVTFVEYNRRFIQVIESNIKICGFSLDMVDIIPLDVLKALSLPILSKRPYHVIFADPPYRYRKWKILLSKIALNVNIVNYGLLILEHPSRVNIPVDEQLWIFHKQYIYGDTSLTVLKKYGNNGHISRDL